MDKVIIDSLHVQAIVGLNPWERGRPQELVVSVAACVDLRQVAQADDLGAGVDYADLARDIRALVAEARRYTIEALAEDIAGLCLRRRGVQKVIVRVEKPKAVIGAVSVGVEIERPAPVDS